MKRLALMLLVLAAIAACDKQEAEVAENPTAEQTAPQETAEPAEAEKGEPAETAESGKKAQSLADDIKDGEKRFFGAEFTVIEAPITLAKAIETAKASPDTALKVTAKVDKVCRKKGCWFTMVDDSVEEPIRVRMQDYGFFVSRNSDGAECVVEGKLASREIPQDEAQHYADEASADGKAEKVEGPQQVWEFTATAVEMTKS